MKFLLTFSIMITFLAQSNDTFSQQPKFNLIATDAENNWSTIADIKQDPLGYIWISTALRGLQRFDGLNFVSYINDPHNPNSLANNRVPCMYIDSSGIIWAATYGGGLDKFDPLKNKFIHFRHNQEDVSSLSNDTVFTILRDHSGILWVGTYGGLDMLDEKTGKFIHYKNIPGDPSSLSFNRVWHLYEDKQGTLWIGCGSPFFNLGEKPEDGGLNKFDRITGKFVRYLNDARDSNSIVNNKVRAIFEDSKGNFWIGSAGDGLQTMDRRTGQFTHYYYDPDHPDKLSRPPQGSAGAGRDHITFINEDVTGSIWIGTLLGGINKYDPISKKIIHFGIQLKDDNMVSSGDTSAGFKDFCGWRSLSSRDKLFWITTSWGNLYNVNPEKKSIPYYSIPAGVSSLYYDADKNFLWIGSINGLVCRDLTTKVDKFWKHDPLNSKSLCNDSITSLKSDGKGNLWIATFNGLCKFNFRKEEFTTYRHNGKDQSGISGNVLSALFIDHNKNLWVSTGNYVIDKMDMETGVFTHYVYNKIPNGPASENAFCFSEDSNNDVWFGTLGLIKLSGKNGSLSAYLQTLSVTSICIDAGGNIWAGSTDGLYRYDRNHDEFLSFINPNTQMDIKGIINIVEDKNQNLWITANNTLVKINKKRDQVKVYGESYGVYKNTLYTADNMVGKNGELFLGDQSGYYAFFPEMIKDNSAGPLINFTGFKINDHEINASPDGILKEPLWQTKEVKLDYAQNTFSFDFFAIDYKSSGQIKYLFKMENYDNSWHQIGTDHKAYLFNVPPGKYLFKVKAVNGDGNWSEKAISIIISPPWWRTWWAYTSLTILIIAFIWAFIAYRSRNLRNANKLLEEKVVSRTHELQKQKEKVESTLTELKSTQAQLIQSEKMASLGELTAGIAHEIQNPLNFVNNFSEVNAELIEELQEERKKENRDVKNEDELLNDLKENEQKINHHGKRADAIVKGMLQHSRTNTGQKELTDINALTDEYLRLSYHGFRAKDQVFNTTIQKKFDEDIGKINIIPQDIGRVLLNLFNNAFYSVNEKNKNPGEAFEPAVFVSTKKINDKSDNCRIEISVKDNGAGIPQKILDKIFQPFFTTKPTGQGTGLGLSLSYDIIKAHGGEIKVETKENEGAEFTVILPVS